MIHSIHLSFFSLHNKIIKKYFWINKKILNRKYDFFKSERRIEYMENKIDNSPVTVHGDGTITVNGTATSTTYFNFIF